MSPEPSSYPLSTTADARPARIAPATPPFSEAIQRRLERVMPPGVEPLVLFTTLARDERLFERFMRASLLDPGHLTLHQREVVIDRVTARCGSEYEWGVHVALFAPAAGLDADKLRSTRSGGAADPCWNAEDALLVSLCDALHDNCTVDDRLWAELGAQFDEETIIELLLLCGFYRTVSYLTNALRLPLEPGAARFADH
jgi:alkylhydroperoxidase family enzyme